ncbi:MAG: hypothetical protein JO263_08150 [Candidatus Eremiobacteraeota bacterium]|nr:hypothetical protein [Candidatus Eremiobacteraeota bacterium]
MSKLYAGIDGGQSSTVAAIGDERGRVVGRGRAGAADEVGQGRDSTRMHDALAGALNAALREAGLPRQTTFESIVAGVSGYQGRVYGKMPALPAMRFRLMHDAPIAHAGALDGQAGVIVIAGTGSVVYGRSDDGTSRTFGGWGFLFGDEGSAFALARDALARLMRAHDDGDESLAALDRETCDFFAQRTLRDLVHAVGAGEITRDRIASFAPAVLRRREFRELADRGADRLAQLAIDAIRAGAPPLVALCGGVFGDEHFARRVSDAIRVGIPDAAIAPAKYDPALGALLLAYREAGVNVNGLRA